MYELFEDALVKDIMKIPLFNCVNDDLHVWWHEKNGIYIVCFVYRLIMNDMADLLHFRVDRKWSLIWRLRVPPQVRLFM